MDGTYLAQLRFLSFGRAFSLELRGTPLNEVYAQTSDIFSMTFELILQANRPSLAHNSACIYKSAYYRPFGFQVLS